MKITKLTVLILMLGGIIHIALGQTSASGTDFLYAKRLYNDAMYDIAAEQFHEFAEKNPNSPQAPEALLLAGDSYFKLGEFEQARKEFIYLILRFPQATMLDQAQYKIGESFRAENNYAEAAKAFQQLTVFYPESKLVENALFDAAAMYRKSGQYVQAIEIYFSYLEENSTSTRALEIQLELARTFFGKGELQRALNEAEKIITKTKKGEIRAQAQLLKAEIEFEFGKIEQAELTLQNVVNDYGTPSAKYPAVLAEVFLKLAEIYRSKGQYQQAIKQLTKPEIAQLPSAKLKQIELLLGDNYFDNQNYRAATEQYRKAMQTGDSAELLYKIGYSLEKTGDYQQAIDNFKQLSELCTTEDVHEDRHCEKAGLAIARNYQHLERPMLALKYLNEYEIDFPDSPCLDQVRYEQANIYERELDEHERALRLYYDIVEDFPHSNLVDDAQLGVAHCFESQQNFSQALVEYQRYLKLYPGADNYTEVEQRITYLEKFRVKQQTGALHSFASIIGEVINQPAQVATTYKLALTYFNELKDYETAITLLKKCDTDDTENIPHDELLYYLAAANHNLALKELYEQGTTSAYFEEAQANYLKLVERYPESQWSDNAVIGILKTKLAQVDSISNKNKIYREILATFVDNYPQSEFLAYAHFNYGRAMLANGIKHSADSIAVFDNLKKVIALNPDEKFSGAATYFQGIAFLTLGDTANAEKMLTQFVEKYPAVRYIVQGHFKLAMLYQQQKKYDAALEHLKRIVTAYFYSRYANEAHQHISDIYLKMKRYSTGLDYFLNLQQQLGNSCFDDHKSDRAILENEILFRLGLFSSRAGDRADALKYLLDYLKKAPDGRYTEPVLFELAGLYQTKNALDQQVALSFLQRLIREFPQSTYRYEASVQAGDILFEQQQYADARINYLEAAKLAASTEEKLYPRMRAIICLHKSNLVARGDQETEKFKDEFDDIDDYLGQIEIAKGDYYFQRKYFETAEDIYKSARGKFKKTRYGPLAELKLGKLYLTLNKDDDALKILTEMPKKYPNNPVIPDVYLALGEFYYYKARQPENAMYAFKNAVDDSLISKSSLEKGLSYLIKTCLDLQLWDQALTVSRRYINRFPLASNAFDIRIQIGIIYNKLNEYDRAIDYLRSLKREADRESEPRIQFWIADSYWEKGYFEKAIIEYLKVRYLSKPSKLNWAVTAQYKAGLAYMKLDKNEQAKRLFRKIIQEHGAESPFGKGAQKKIDEIDQFRSE